jgi:exo-1,4-beta-D-glucosaminidase
MVRKALSQLLRRFGSGPGIVAAGTVFAALGATCALAQSLSEQPMPLHEGWSIQSGCKLQATGDVISTTAFHPQGWMAAKVPSTVLAAQVAAGVLPDPYYGTNLRSIPGTSYPVGENFANHPMPDDSPYRCSWWYRKEFTVPAADKGKRAYLHFGGINYRANVWLNGKRIADSTQVAGAYRTYEFDVTDQAALGKPNVLAVETIAPTEKDLGVNWVDWNPCPPDKDMGLWGPVTLTTSGPVTLRSPLVTTHFPNAGNTEQAELTVYAELHNGGNHAVNGVVSGTVAGIRLEQKVALAPGESKTVVFDPNQYAALHVTHPRLWWPYQMGTPTLEEVRLGVTVDGKLSDEQTSRFGIREITSEMTDKGYRLFRVNGKPVLIRGAGWSQDMLLRQNHQYLENELRLVRDMNLNTIRLEGKLETEDFFHMADEQGILVMLGWCCCDQWEHWKDWTPENYKVSAESLRSQMLRIRNHASLLVWLNGSDNPPPADVEQAYLDIEKETHWPNPTLSSATAAPTTVSGKSGVKMTGPYDYVAPSYWLAEGNAYGGAYGFNTETSPGPAIPTLSSLKKFLPKQSLWPQDAAWSLHDGGGEFRNLTVYDESMKAEYGAPSDLAGYVQVSQTMAYSGERAMFEAYARNKYTSTGVIQWMLNNAWPSMIWHLYDYYLDAGGGYYGTKKACEPVHVQYSYDDHSVVVVNSTYQPVSRLGLQVKVYDQDLKELFSQQQDVRMAAADSSTRVVTIPDSAFAGGTKIFFVKLTLRWPSGEPVSENFYWLPASLTTFDWAKTDYTHTPAIQHEDLTALHNLPKAQVEVRSHLNPATGAVEVALRNPSKALAFQVSVAAQDKNGENIDPALWSDNYIELMPGESRHLTVEFPNHKPGEGPAAIAVSGWNIPPVTLSLTQARNVAQSGNAQSHGGE